jgi:serine/threonine protein kinase
MNDPPKAYAIKILYDRQFHTTSTVTSSRATNHKNSQIGSSSLEGESVSELRFKFESKIGDTIRMSCSKIGIIGDLNDYVAPKDYTRSFDESPAFSSLKSLYEVNERPFNLSKYAIIMDYCDLTLKDLLEKIWYVYTKDDNTVEMTDNEADVTERSLVKQYVGYNILKELSFEERLKYLLPFTTGLCKGLSILHVAKQIHHDLKPANVFVKLNVGDFQIKLGDFSFAAPAIERGTNVTFLRDAISTGTVHFRSPEQRDIADSAEGTVLHALGRLDLSNYNKLFENQPVTADDVADIDDSIAGLKDNIAKKNIFLIRIRDPKFLTSDIKQGDALVFSGDNLGAVYRVFSVVKFDLYGDVWLNLSSEPNLISGDDQLNQVQKAHPHGEKTQIVIYRMPSQKSDLFGFGAIFFDLLTCGASPEEFYEKMKSFDIPQTTYGSEASSIEAILSIYEEFRTSGTNKDKTVATQYISLYNAFSVFEEKRGDAVMYSPPWAVKLILECMMYNPKDNIYHKFISAIDANRSASDQITFHSPIDMVLQELNERMKIYKTNYSSDNILIKPHRSNEWNLVIKARIEQEIAAAHLIALNKDKAAPVDEVDPAQSFNVDQLDVQDGSSNGVVGDAGISSSTTSDVSATGNNFDKNVMLAKSTITKIVKIFNKPAR